MLFFVFEHCFEYWVNIVLGDYWSATTSKTIIEKLGWCKAQRTTKVKILQNL